MPKAKGFKLYDVIVRLGGSRDNEIRKTGVTAPEIMVLGTLHGPDSLHGMVASKAPPADRSDNDERARLAGIYEGTSPAKRGFIARVFGPSTIPLPREVSSDYQPQEQVDPQRVPAEIADTVEPHAALMG